MNKPKHARHVEELISQNRLKNIPHTTRINHIQYIIQQGPYDRNLTHTMEVNKPYTCKNANCLKKAQSKANGVHNPTQTVV
jgi:hypothetical protein